MPGSRAALPMDGLPRPAEAASSGATADPNAPRTLAARLRMQLSDEIVRGELAPGVTLDETELARRFQVSRTPVREAIRLLGASGLVEARPHRSAVVARPDKAQLVAMFETLRELEVLMRRPGGGTDDGCGARCPAALAGHCCSRLCTAAIRSATTRSTRSFTR